MNHLRVLASVNLATDDFRAARRAAAVARAMSWELILQASVYHADFARDLFHISGALEKTRQDLEADSQARLRSLASELDFDQASVDARWVHPFDQGLNEALVRTSPHMVAMSLREPGQVSRSEWRFIQSCPVPLLLVGNQTWPDSPLIMACVDPSHAHGKSDLLDGDILNWSSRITVGLGGHQELLHAAGMLPDLKNDDPYPDRYRSQVENQRSMEIRRLAPEREADSLVMHFSHTSPVEAIEAFIKARNVNLCVLGSISRSWLEDKLIGGTLREILPRAECDLMLIPPLMG